MSEAPVMDTHEQYFAQSSFGQTLFATCQAFSLFGGTVFILLTLMSLISIVGRKLFSLPVPGDFELMQMGCAFASAAFLPYCQMIRGHVRVDFFTSRVPARIKTGLNFMSALLVGLFGLVIGWRAAAGALTAFQSGETSTILGWPIWLAQALMVPSFVLLAAAGLYIAYDELSLAASERQGEGAPPVGPSQGGRSQHTEPRSGEPPSPPALGRGLGGR